MPKRIPAYLPAVRVHTDVDPAPPPILSVTIVDACRISGMGRTAIYEAITDGRLSALKAGQRTLIPMDSLRALIASLPPYAPNTRTLAATEARKRQRTKIGQADARG